MTRIAAFPMYDFPELRQAHDTLWAAIAVRLEESGTPDVPRALTRDLGHFDLWRHRQLLLAQACEYPLATSFAGCARVVATPRYAAPGCSGASCRSAIVVRKNDVAQTLDQLRNRRCAINEPSSNSGMNLLRAALAPLAGGGTFFASVVLTGSHRGSVAAVAAGEADVAAIDCVSLAHFRRLYGTQAAQLRILCWTPASPSLPFITAGTADDSTVAALRDALADVMSDRTLDLAREALLLEGINLEPDGRFTRVLTLDREAARLGYPRVC